MTQLNGSTFRGAALAGAVGLALSAWGVAASSGSSASGLRAAKVSGYGEVLANNKDFSLYLLAKKDSPHPCTGSCTTIWPPLLVPKGTHVSKNKGVKGTIKLIPRGRKEQVTYNGWPLYSYVGDSGRAGSAGEGIKSFGGTWYLVKASATRHDATPIKRSSSSSGGGGW